MVEVHYHNTHHSTLLQERQKLENFGRELVSAHSGSGLCACHFVRVLVCVRVVGAVLVIGPSAEMPRQPCSCTTALLLDASITASTWGSASMPEAHSSCARSP